MITIGKLSFILKPTFPKPGVQLLDQPKTFQTNFQFSTSRKKTKTFQTKTPPKCAAVAQDCVTLSIMYIKS